MDTGDTGWVLASSALVLLMTPGLAFFYGGMVRRKNAASTIMQAFMAIGVRVSEEDEEIGLDLTRHGEEAYAERA